MKIFNCLFKSCLVLAGSVALISASGCSSGHKTNEKQTENNLSHPNPEALKNIKIGMSIKTLSAPYFVALVNTVKKKTEEMGMKFVYVDAQDDINKQISSVEDLLVQGINVLIFDPLDPKALVQATKSATRAGVPVIIVDSSIDPSADYVTNILSNNLENGELVGEWLVNKTSGKKLKIALLSGAQGNPVGKERREGIFRGIIEQQLRSIGKVEFEIVSQGWGNWTYEGGLKAMEDMLVAHPDINVLVSEQDAMALGAIQAIEAAGRSKDIIIVAGADGQKAALKLIKDGKYGATGLNDPLQIGKQAVEIAIKILSGERNFPKVIYTPAVCISIENVDEHYNPDAIF
jgi:ribose transport system substrate-binding protein